MVACCVLPSSVRIVRRVACVRDAMRCAACASGHAQRGATRATIFASPLGLARRRYRFGFPIRYKHAYAFNTIQNHRTTGDTAPALHPGGVARTNRSPRAPKTEHRAHVYGLC